MKDEGFVGLDNVSVGTWLSIQNTTIVEVLSNLPLDWLMFDMEHGPADISSLQDLLPAVSDDVVSFVRVPWKDKVMIKRALDLGFEGMLVPYVNNREEVEEIINAFRYPPRGIRGVGPRRAIEYGEKDMEEYYKNFEEDLIFGVQIETKESLNNLNEILSVDEVDMAFVGPYDLSANLGIFGELNHPDFEEAINEVLNECKNNGVTPGIYAGSREAAEKWIDKGFSFVSLGQDFSNLREKYLTDLQYLKS
ncbi:MAG: HpcH/HpaI aldolase family protein [archaeon]